jgi:hypothetical protein
MIPDARIFAEKIFAERILAAISAAHRKWFTLSSRAGATRVDAPVPTVSAIYRERYFGFGAWAFLLACGAGPLRTVPHGSVLPFASGILPRPDLYPFSVSFSRWISTSVFFGVIPPPRFMAGA